MGACLLSSQCGSRVKRDDVEEINVRHRCCNLSLWMEDTGHSIWRRVKNEHQSAHRINKWSTEAKTHAPYGGAFTISKSIPILFELLLMSNQRQTTNQSRSEINCPPPDILQPPQLSPGKGPSTPRRTSGPLRNSSQRLTCCSDME